MTTGFYRAMSDVLLKEVKSLGYTPDAVVAGDEVRNGSRPNPHMLYKNMDLLNISSIQVCVECGKHARKYICDQIYECVMLHN
jgi:beta-phosphoglucomutase-like phosphatase (HAD superfamily)